MNRRQFLTTAAAGSAAASGALQAGPLLSAQDRARPPVIDTHMHVWAADAKRYPFPHPYQSEFRAPPCEATVEMLLDDMDQNGLTHAILVQGEYRWEIWSGFDAALFYDAGKVANSRSDLDFSNLESDYGFGFRFNTNEAIIFRVDAGFGSQDGKHLYITFGGVF